MGDCVFVMADGLQVDQVLDFELPNLLVPSINLNPAPLIRPSLLNPDEH